ncbi:hypothetical protein BC941DRAFT_108617 [Chlamydoabsidia padenii]|nr:hypothetical protein BC941DRAFT_108617 [Chlamydoabsidia padenii]
MLAINDHPSSSAFQRIPDELQIKILGYLTVQDLLKVTGVCHKWYNLAYEGSLWQIIDTTPFYKSIPGGQLLKIGLAAGNFLKVANFRGCLQLTSHMLRVLSEYCINVESLHLKDCRRISTPSIACFLQHATRLTLLDLSGLDSVKNSTLQVIGQYLPFLEKLNLSWCKNITGQGLQQLVMDGGQCHSLTLLKLNGVALIDETTLGHLADHSPKLRQLSLASCPGLTDAALGRLLSPTTECRLTHLNLTNCSRLTDRALQHLALHGGDQLAHLELAGCNRLTDTGFAFMALRLRSLVYLDLEDVIQITSITVRALANNQPHLKRLCLSNCTHIDDDAAQYLLLHGVCTTLEYLELDDCGITDAFLDTLATFLVDQHQKKQQQQHKTRLFTLQQSSSTDSGFTETYLSSSPLSTSSLFGSNKSNPSIHHTQGGELDEEEEDKEEEPRRLTIRVLDCGNISESGIRSAMDKAHPFLVIKSFYTWRDENDDPQQQEQQQPVDTRQQQQQHSHPSTGRNLADGHRNQMTGQPSSLGCIIL